MLSTLYLILLIAFQLWYLTSKQVKAAHIPAYLNFITHSKQTARITGGVLLTAALVLFIVKLGWVSGTCAAIIGLMGVGCLTIAIQPFDYLRVKTVALLYLLSLTLEFLI